MVVNHLVRVMTLILLSSSPAQTTAHLPLRVARLPSAEKGELAAKVMSELDDRSRGDQRRIAFDSQVTFLPLRPGAPPAILLEPSDEGNAALCAPNGNGNCPFWIFEQLNGHAVLLFEDDGESIRMSKSSHHGMHDLILIGRVGHTPLDEVTTQFHFDGKTYQAAICSEEIAGVDENDPDVRVPPHPCNTPGHQVVLPVR